MSGLFLVRCRLSLEECGQQVATQCFWASCNGAEKRGGVEIGGPLFYQPVLQNNLVDDWQPLFAASDGSNHRPVDEDEITSSKPAMYISLKTWELHENFSEGFARRVFPVQRL